MLIFEGPDCFGMTTAAKRLGQLVDQATDEDASPETQFPIRYAHMGRPPKAFDFFWDYHDLISKFAIMDRFHLGAMVWHDDAMNEARLRIIEGWLLSVASVTVIMCSFDDEHYASLLDKDPKQQMFDRDTLMVASQTYAAMAEGTHSLNPRHDHVWVSTPGHPFPTEDVLQDWWTTWLSRLQELGR